MSAPRFRQLEQKRTVSKYLRGSKLRISPGKLLEVGFGGIKVPKVAIG